MSIIKKLEDSIWAKVILAAVVVVIAFAARSMLENKHEESQIDKRQLARQYVRQVMQRRFRRMIQFYRCLKIHIRRRKYCLPAEKM